MSDGVANASTSETSTVEAVVATVTAPTRGKKGPLSPEDRKAQADKARNRRLAEKFKKAKDDDEAASLARQYLKSRGEEPDEPEPQPMPEPETREAVRPVVEVDESGWPPVEKTAANLEGAAELWSIARDNLPARYADCLKPKRKMVPEQTGVDGQGAPVVELKEKLVDPIAQLARPTAALMARSETKLSPGWALVIATGMVFGPTVAKHLGELGAAVYLKVKARQAMASRIAEPPAPTPAPTQSGDVVEMKRGAG